nr:MAG TPA: hypothetical protein [Caudoviricetes sp.]
MFPSFSLPKTRRKYCLISIDNTPPHCIFEVRFIYPGTL